jgi:hypothetical protein
MHASRPISTLISTFITYPLVHIHQKKKIAPEIAAQIGSVNEPYYKLFAKTSDIFHG